MSGVERNGRPGHANAPASVGNTAAAMPNGVGEANRAHLPRTFDAEHAGESWRRFLNATAAGSAVNSCLLISGEDFVDHFAVHIGQPEVPPAEPVREFLVIEPQLMEDRGMQVVQQNRVFGD